MMQYIIPSVFLTGSRDLFLDITSLVSITLGINTIISKNPVFSLLFLIALFGTISIYLISIGLTYIGLSYLLVYIGAISILFIFILMLINIRISELSTESNNSILLAIFTLMCFSSVTYNMLPYNNYIYGIVDLNVVPYMANIFTDVITTNLEVKAQDAEQYTTNLVSNKQTALSHAVGWDTMIISTSHIILIGNILYTNYLSLFVILSLILILAMVGAIIITIRR